MELNITLFVQMGHFLIAYIILDRIFLRIAVVHIRAEDRKIALLEQQLRDQQARVTERVHHNEQDWLILQKRLRAQRPGDKLGKHVAYSAEEEVAPMVIAAREQSKAVALLESALIERARS